MKIGDRCFVCGFVDEIRKDTVIIRNRGGYFGTDPGEVVVTDTERPTGQWLSVHTDEPVKFAPIDRCSPIESCYCSKCGAWLVASDEYAVVGRYCPNCGAKMEGIE